MTPEDFAQFADSFVGAVSDLATTQATDAFYTALQSYLTATDDAGRLAAATAACAAWDARTAAKDTLPAAALTILGQLPQGAETPRKAARKPRKR